MANLSAEQAIRLLELWHDALTETLMLDASVTIVRWGRYEVRARQRHSHPYVAIHFKPARGRIKRVRQHFQVGR